MARFIYHIDGKEVDVNDIPDSPIKTLFAEVRVALDAKLYSQECRIHHRQPVISLFSENGRFTGYGFGGCCEEFSDIIRPLMTVNIPGLDSSTMTTVRTTKYMTYTG